MTLRSLTNRLDLCSINTATLGHRLPIQETIELIAQAGFGAIAPWRRDLKACDVRAVGQQIRDAGLSVNAYCRSTYLTASDSAEFRSSMLDNCQAIEEAAVLGADCFVMVVGGLPKGSKDLKASRSQVIDGVSLLREQAKSYGVALALEPLHPMYAADRSCLCTLEQALDICEQIEPEGFKSLGVAVDVYHCWWDPNLSGQLSRAGAGKRILGFHVSDWLVPTTDMLLDRGMMGDGVIDLQSIRRAVEDAGYRGYVEVEIFSRDRWWGQPESHVLATCAQRLQQNC